MNQPATQTSSRTSEPARLLHSVPLDTRDTATFRQQLKAYFLNTSDVYESLFETLACTQAWYEKPIALRHPLIFYYGHTATFFINKMLLARLVEKRVNPHLESIFAVGVDEMSWDDLDDTHYEWPTIEEVRDYRQKIRAIVTEIIDHAPLTLPVNWDHPWWSIVMGIEHERIHIETSSVLIRQQKLAYIKPHPAWHANKKSGRAPTNQLINIPAGAVTLGRNKDEPRYGWDNEFGQHEADIPAFSASRFLVSNQEFLSFVEDNGYAHPEHWEEEGQQWLEYSHASQPEFWVKDGDQWWLRLMTEEIPMPWDWPVEVNAHEARAFCHWKGKQIGKLVRLPSEDEWQRLLAESGWQPSMDANLYLDHGASSTPVNQFAHGNFYDMIGNVWQWTETPTYPYDGFEVHPYYDDFTTPTYDGRHAIIKGGSWISAGNEAETDSRYAFRRHFFQHAGFRYITAEKEAMHPSQYETDKLLSEYAEFHYGANYFNVPNFSKALVELALKHLGNTPRHHALDIGCASGRATFELAQYFEAVTGIDFSARFIRQGVALANGESLRYMMTEEGHLSEPKEVDLAQLGLADISSKVSFFQGDACNLKPIYTGYDFILAANLLDRLYEPMKFLASIHERLNKGGLMMLTTPCTWLAEHTPPANWLGGFNRDGKPVRTLDTLHDVLGSHFEAVGEAHAVPFVIRETKRKFQHTLSEVTLWRKVR